MAVDFGTTNSVVARWDVERACAEVMHIPGLSLPPGPDHPPIIPSLIYVLDGSSGTAVLGQAVLDQGLARQRDARFFRAFKRGILSATGAHPRLIDGAAWSDGDAGRRFLRGLFEALPFPLDDLEQLVVTAPVGAFEGYLTWLSAGMGVPGSIIRLVDESTAAALGYAITQPGAALLVFDFGGGSLDLSLVQLPESRQKTGGWLESLRGRAARGHAARVIAKAGINLGGSDVDGWLLQWALDRLGLPGDVLGDAPAGALAACEAVKIALSSQNEAELTLHLPDGPQTLTITRAELERLLNDRGFYSSIHTLLDRAMHTARRQGIFTEDIRNVLVVGGASLMPSVQALLRSYFRPEAVQVDKPFTAIAEGALAAAMGGGLQDYLLHSYGLRVFDPAISQARLDEIIPAGDEYPTPKPVEVELCAAHPRQEWIDLVVGEAGSQTAQGVEVRYEDGQAVFVDSRTTAGSGETRWLNAVAPLSLPLSPPGQPGEIRLRAAFRLDAQRRLLVDVLDVKTNKELARAAVVVDLSGSVGDHQTAAKNQEGYLTSLRQGLSYLFASPEIVELGARSEQAVVREGREPALPPSRPVQPRLSLRALGMLFSVLPPESISLDAARAALTGDDFYARFSAAEVLSKRGDREARRILHEVLTRGQAPQRAAVAHHLHRLSWFSAEPLIRQALADKDRRVRESAVYSLCMLRGPDAYALLVETLQNADDALRLSAAWGLSKQPEAAAVPALALVLRSTDPQTRVMALETLGETGALEAGLPLALAALDDPDLEVRYAAALTWVELAGEAALPGLAARILQANGTVRACFAKALFHATNYLFMDVSHSLYFPAILEALEAAICDDDPETRLAASMPLAWLHDPACDGLLLTAFGREPVSETRIRMLMHAVHLSSPAGKSMLKAALQDADEDVRQTAVYLSRTYGIEA